MFCVLARNTQSQIPAHDFASILYPQTGGNPGSKTDIMFTATNCRAQSMTKNFIHWGETVTSRRVESMIQYANRLQPQLAPSNRLPELSAGSPVDHTHSSVIQL